MKPSFSLRSLERALSSRPFTLTPSSRYSPPLKVSSRPAMLRKVVLPEPEGPVTATNSPCLTWMSKPRSAWVSIMCVRYTLLKLVMRSIVGSSLRSCRVWGSVVDGDALGVLEGIGAGDHDAVAHLQAGKDLDRGHAGGAQLDRAAHGDAAVHHVGGAAALVLDEGAARQHQHVRLLLDQHARGQALVL